MARKKVGAVSPEYNGGEEDKKGVSSRTRTLVFISHDSRDADLAEAFGNLLTDVSAGTLKSFRSSDKKGNTGIEFGTEWYTAIMSQLGYATDVVALLTHHSLDRPWILYEAGVAKGKLDTNVLGVALGVPLDRVSTGPFGQFQNCGDDEDSITKLVLQLIRRNPEAAPREDAVRMQVRVFLESAKKLLASKSKQTSIPAQDDASAAKLFEEVKVMMRELPERLDDRIRTTPKRFGKRSRRFHPMMMEQLLMHPAFRETRDGPATILLIMFSAFKEELPWLYELGVELYRALRGDDRQQINRALKSFNTTFELIVSDPFLHDFAGPEGEDAFFMARQLPKIIDRVIDATFSKTLPKSERNRVGESLKRDVPKSDG